YETAPAIRDSEQLPVGWWERGAQPRFCLGNLSLRRTGVAQPVGRDFVGRVDIWMLFGIEERFACLEVVHKPVPLQYLATPGREELFPRKRRHDSALST